MVEGEQAQPEVAAADFTHKDGELARMVVPNEPTAATEPRWRWWLPHLVLLALLVGALAVHLYHLDHLYITSWDESVHAIIAEHVAQHPLVPTLYAIEALPPPDLTHWDSVHIWLHILPFGMWMVGLSMKMFGDIPLALRLPGVVFMAIGMIATYFLGRRLFGDSLAGLVGAFVVGFGPLALAVNQGFAFGDMTDTPLLGLTPLLVLATVAGWQTGKLRWLAVAGVIQGCLYLAKGAMGLAPLAIIVALYLSDMLMRPQSGWSKPGWRALLAFFGAAAGVIAPFSLYFNTAFPQSVAAESLNWRIAFFGNYEGWGAPPDYHVTTYFYLMYGTALALLLVLAALTTGMVAVLRQSRADLVLIVWILAVYIPITIAVTKSPPMGLPAMAAFGLAVGRAISLTVLSRERLWQAIGLGVVLGTVLMTLILASGNTLAHAISNVDLAPRMINPTIFFFRLTQPQRQNPYLIELWLSWVIALAFGGLFAIIDRRRDAPLIRRFGDVLKQVQGYSRISVVSLAVAFVCLGFYVTKMDVAFVARPLVNPGPAPIVGPYLAQHTTPNTTILFDDRSFTNLTPYNGHDDLMVMFWAHRDTYTAPKLDAQSLCPIVQQAARKSSPVVLVTQQPYAGTRIGAVAGWSLYRLDTCG